LEGATGAVETNETEFKEMLVVEVAVGDHDVPEVQ
jgi:hypothetical protein